MEKTIFVLDGPDKHGRFHVIEGEPKPKNTLNVKRFICEVQQQETEAETKEVGELIVNALTAFKK